MEALILGGLVLAYVLGAFFFGRWVGANDALDALDDSLRRHGVGKPVTLKFDRFQVQGTVRRNV